MMLPAPRTASGAIDRASWAAPAVELADRSRGGLRFPLGEQLEGDLPTPRPR